MLVAFLPYLWYLFKTSASKYRGLYIPLLAFLVIAIYFSYTRAAQLSVILAVVYYYIVKFRLTKLGVGLALVGGLAGVMYMSTNNNYQDFAPDFSKTIAHKKFDNLVEATTKMEDISTVERFYRWVAGVYMVAEKPMTGFGPSTFYSTYDGYTVTSYKTYVSDNPEKSGIHNNYLMVAVEQGLPGLLIMIMLVIIPLIMGEQLYHRLKDAADKQLCLAALTSFFLISVVILINDKKRRQVELAAFL